MYIDLMKRKHLEKQLREIGWYFLRHGGKHDVWTNGTESECIPRHTEVNEMLAKKILRTAWRHYNPARGGKK